MPADLSLLNGYMMARRQGATERLAPKAMSGDLSALNQLMAINPEAGAQVGQQLNYRAQQMQQQQQAQQEQARWEAENQIAQQRLALEQQKAEQAGAGGYFGEGFTGKAFDLISQAEKNPAIKQTPEYKMAVAYLNKGQVIQTEQGAIQVPGMDVESILAGKKQAAAPTDGVLPGTEKLPQLQKDYNEQFTTLENARKQLVNFKKALTEHGPKFAQEVEASDLQQAYAPLVNSFRELSNLKMGGAGVDLLEGMIENPVVDPKHDPVKAARLMTDRKAYQQNLLKGVDAAIADLENRTDTFNKAFEGTKIQSKEFTPLREKKKGSHPEDIKNILEKYK